MENTPDNPLCPACRLSDQVGRLSVLVESDTELAKRFPPPEEPQPGRPLFGMNEGLGCLGALFFGSAFVLSVTYRSLTGGIIFGIFVLLFAITFLLAILRGMRERRMLAQRLAAWQPEWEAWSQRYYCARDDLVFDL